MGFKIPQTRYELLPVGEYVAQITAVDEDDLETTDSGLMHYDLEEGDGDMPEAGGTVTTDFALALDLVSTAGLDRLVSAHYPLDRWREAIAHAAEAGPRGAIKVVFDQR